MIVQKTLLSTLALGLVGGSSLFADDVGVDIPASSYNFESMPEDPFVIRDMGTKVGYIKADSVRAESWGYDNFDFGEGATSLTVRAASATEGGTLYVRLRNQNNPSLTIATVEISNTGGWNEFQDFTVDVNRDVLDWFGMDSPDLYFVVERDDEPNYLFDVESFRFDNANEGLILAADFDAESYPSNDDIVRNMGTKVGYTTNGSWIRFNSFEFPTGATSLTVTASSATNGGTLYVTSRAPKRFGGHLIATIDVGNTGGWDQFEEFSASVEAPADGTSSSLFLSFEGDENYLFDVQFLRFDFN